MQTLSPNPPTNYTRDEIQMIVNYAYMKGHRDCLDLQHQHPRTLGSTRKVLMSIKSKMMPDMKAVAEKLIPECFILDNRGEAPLVAEKPEPEKQLELPEVQAPVNHDEVSP